MPDALHDSGTELFLEDFSLAGEAFSPSLDEGQAVVVAGGALQGVMGTVAKSASRGQYLVSIGKQSSQFWVKLPGNLLLTV
jgi:hypothetical protein